MESGRQAVKVCVCGAGENQTTLLLQAVAAGHVFGPAQRLTMTLHDGVERSCDLAEEALDLLDACFPLVMGVQTETDLTKSLSQSDVIMLIVQATGLDDMLPVIADYAATLNKASRTKMKAVIVVGHQALSAAGMLCVLTPQLSRRQVTAVDFPVFQTLSQQQRRGGYLLAEAVSKHVSSWWSELQMNDNVTKGSSFQSIPGMPVTCFLPLPREMTSPDSEPISGRELADWEHIKSALQDVSAAVERLQLTESQLVRSAVSCQL